MCVFVCYMVALSATLKYLCSCVCVWCRACVLGFLHRKHPFKNVVFINRLGRSLFHMCLCVCVHLFCVRSRIKSYILTYTYLYTTWRPHTQIESVSIRCRLFIHVYDFYGFILWQRIFDCKCSILFKNLFWVKKSRYFEG